MGVGGLILLRGRGFKGKGVGIVAIKGWGVDGLCIIFWVAGAICEVFVFRRARDRVDLAVGGQTPDAWMFKAGLGFGLGVVCGLPGVFGWIPGMILAFVLWGLFGLTLGWLLPRALGWLWAGMVALGVLVAWAPLGLVAIGLWTSG